MSSLNKVMLIGNLGRDPETRHSQAGDPITTLNVATSEQWTDRQTGEKRERTEWHRVVIFNDGLAKIAADYLRKGSKVYVEGQIQSRKWTDQQGNDRYTTEVVLQKYRGALVLLDPRRDRDDAIEGDHAQQQPHGAGNLSDDLNDEIPFVVWEDVGLKRRTIR